jgi:uncharacterized protein
MFDFARLLTLKVHMLNKSDFSSVCSRLARKIEVDIKPDLVIGIPKGGAVICRQMFLSGFFKNVCYGEVSYQRVTTKYKKEMKIRWLLKRLPIQVNNLLRILESTVREIKHESFRGRYSNGQPICEMKTEELIRKSSTIVVIDDAVDSGETILKVSNMISEINATAMVKTAVITKTFKNPLLHPDITIFCDVLVRYPWSEDYCDER